MDNKGLDIRRTIFDVVNESFQALNLKTYRNRLIYTGEYSLAQEEIRNIFQSSVKNVNQNYCDIPITGLLLLYASYFVHIVEGSEDTIARQLTFLLNYQHEPSSHQMSEPESQKEPAGSGDKYREKEKDDKNIAIVEKSPEIVQIFKRLKLVVVDHSVKTAHFQTWHVLVANPLILLIKLDTFADIDVHMEMLKTLIQKIRHLCQMFAVDTQLSFEGVSAADKKMEVLPGTALLDFLLDSPHVMDLKTYSSYHRRIPDYTYDFEKVWPPQSHFTPNLLYKLKIDDSFVEPLPIQPWQEKEDDEDEAEGDDSSPDESV